MPDLMDRARSWLSGLLSRPAPPPAAPGEPTALSGLEAIRAVEEASGTALHARGSARDRASEAIGAALAGLRTAVVLDGPELAEAHDLLAWAAGRAAPMVVHATLRAGPGHAIATGTGHEGWHAIADAGCVQLMASTVQEAADLTLVARRLAERVLLPVVVGMDDEQVARSVQDVRLLTTEQVLAFLGEANDAVQTTPTGALVFGPERRRVPRWHDLERPTLHGAPQGGEAWARGAASREAYVFRDVPAALGEIVEALAGETGRPLPPLEADGLSGAQLVLLAQGSLAQTASRVAASLREARAVKVGVVNVRSLRPFPAAELAEALARVPRVVVLERVVAPVGADTPLLQAARAAVSGPAWHGVTVGSGGQPVRAADLEALCRRLVQGGPERLYLGQDFAPGRSAYPRHQAFLDQLKREFGDRAALGQPPSDAVYAVSGAVTIGISGAPEASALVDALARRLHAERGGHLRTRPVSRDRAGWVSRSEQPGRDPGDDVLLDALVLLPAYGDRRAETLPALRRGGAALFVGEGDPWPQLPSATGALLRDADARPFQVGDRDADSVIEAILAVVDQAWDRLRPAEAPTVAEPPLEPEAPLAVRHLGKDTGARGVPRFWAHVGIHYRDGHPEHVVPDPTHSVGAVPPLTASFCDLTGTREQLPVFDPQPCTGCGECWVACPEGALGAVALEPRALIEAGMKLADATDLRPVLGKMAKGAAAALQGRAHGTADQVFGPAIAAAVAGAKVDDERRERMQQAGERLAAALSALPVAATDPFAGEALSIVVDPAACTGCASCVEACAPHALTRQPQTRTIVRQARASWRLWEQLPDTPGETLARIRATPTPGPLASVLLARSSLLGMHGGNYAERGSGGKLALRAVLGMVEAARQPRLVGHLQRIREAAAKVGETIRAELVDALPVGDLDALATGLASEGPAIDVHRLVQRIDDARGGASTLDTRHSARLRRLTLLARGLADLTERVSGEATGLPRARVGAVLHPELAMAWGVRYPHNPFQIPVVVAGTDELVPLAAGLLQGQLEELAGDLALLERAEDEVELRRPPTERDAGAPLLVIGTDEVLLEPALRDAIAAGLPVKVLALSDLDLRRPGLELDLVALGHRGALAIQTSIGAEDHFAERVLDALLHDGPAVLRVHAPSPARHGFAVGHAMERARTAVTSGAWPLFAFDPRKDGALGTRVSLTDRRVPGQNPAAWVAGESRFADAPLDDQERAATWAMLQELAGVVTPFTEVVRSEITAELGQSHQAELARARAEAAAKLADADALARAQAKERLHRRLMELAGVSREEAR